MSLQVQVYVSHLGQSGFLPITSATDGRRRGNYGLYDVIAVLRWLHDNIVAFGGDPDRVSVAGHGIASDFVDLLTVSPLAKGESASLLSLPRIHADAVCEAKNASQFRENSLLNLRPLFV